MNTPVYAPYIQTYAQHAPYVSIDEFIAAPNGINLSEIVPKTDDNTNRQALAEVLSEASSEADGKANQVLAATLETFSGFVRVPWDSCPVIAVPNTPLVAVTGYSTGPSSASLAAATDLTGLTIESECTLRLPPIANATRGSIFAVVSYISGFHNSFATAAVTAGATTITVDNTLGLTPGMQPSLFDPINGANEILTVASTTATTVTFTTGFRFGHPAGARVSMMPPRIKRAVLLLAGAIIRSKFSQTIVVPSASGGQPSVSTTRGASVQDDRDEAERILQDFRRVR